MISKTMPTHGRSTSCQGVSFDSPHPLLDSNRGEYNGRWVWIPWNPSNSIKAFPSPKVLSRTVSRPSSHYCDLNFDPKDIDDEDVYEHEPQHGDHEEKKITLRAALNVEKQESIRKGQQASNKSRLSIILLDQGLFTVYKRLFATCFTSNIIALVLAISGHFPFGKHRPTLISMANILTLILCRSEAFLRIVFWFVVKVLGHPCVPLFIKTTTTSFLQSLGGIHSSCGVSSVAWLIYSLVLTLKAPENTSTEIVFVATTIAALLILSCLSAFPLIRHLHHNVFERTHRFAGWIALALLWAFVVLTVCYNPKTKSYNQISIPTLAGKQEFWFTFAITLFIMLPWLSIKRVPVSVTAPSGHASLIKFEGGIPAGLLGRISRSPLSEWHAFGIISNGKDNHMMLAGAVGDFTKGLVSHPPNHLWVRGLHFAGLPYLVNMYNRAVLVATGSGICVFLSFLLQPCNADVCMVWVTKGVEENFGKEIMEMMSGYPTEKIIIHDTMISGRPNIAKISIEAAKNLKAEVVVVTSNPQGSKDVVSACKTAGFAAFGPIWDS